MALQCSPSHQRKSYTRRKLAGTRTRKACTNAPWHKLTLRDEHVEGHADGVAVEGQQVRAATEVRHHVHDVQLSKSFGSQVKIGATAFQTPNNRAWLDALALTRRFRVAASVGCSGNRSTADAAFACVHIGFCLLRVISLGALV